MDYSQASLSITNSQSLPKLMSTELGMPSNHLILCHPLLLLPSIFPNIRVFSNESALCTRWPKYWSFSCNITMYHTAISLTKEIHLKYTLGYIFPLGFYSNIISTIVFYLHRTNKNCFGNHSKTGKLTSTFTLLLVLS